MKAKKKSKHTEKEGEERTTKTAGDDGQERTSLPTCEEPRKILFLACLQKTWARKAGCKRRKTSSEEKRSFDERPGPSCINLKDSTDDRSYTEKDKAYDIKENTSIKAYKQEKEWMTDSFVEQVILEAYHQIHDQIHSMEVLYIQFYGGQDEEIQNGEKIMENEEDVEIKSQGGEEEREEADKNKESCQFLARVRKSWAWIAGLKHRGTYYITEESSGEIPGPSMVDNKEIKSQGGEEDLEKADKNKKSSQFLARIRKSWAWIADLKHRGTYYIKEESSGEIPGPSMVDNKGDTLSSKGEDDEGIAGSSKESSSGTVPLSLESFTVHKTLGEGSFGIVFLARDVIRKECVAIKAVDKQYHTQLGYSFVEHDILQLSHESPYLIHGLAAFHTQSFVYYVMEVATGGDLLHFIRKNYPLSMETVRFIAAELVCGTQFLHRKGILHRDLKPQNILMTRDGHIKITDFGLAVTNVNNETIEKSKGTPGYAAPEMVKDQAYGRGVDYFAIGVILYKMVTCKPPFPGRNPTEAEHSVLHHTPLYPETLTPDTVNIIERLLCKDQFQRLGVKGDIRKHPFFSDISWEDVEARRMAPPAILMAGSIDLNVTETLDYAEPPNKIKSKHQKMFNQFSFVCPEWSKHYHPVIIQTKNWRDKLFTKRFFRK